MKRWLMIAVLAGSVGLGVPSAWASWDASDYPDEALVNYEAGLEHEEAGRYKDAIKAYNRSLRYKREQVKVFNRLAVCHLALKRKRDAVRYYKKSLWLNPKQAETHRALGELYLDMGKSQFARKTYADLRQVDPESADELMQKIEAAEKNKRWYWPF